MENETFIGNIYKKISRSYFEKKKKIPDSKNINNIIAPLEDKVTYKT